MNRRRFLQHTALTGTAGLTVSTAAEAQTSPSSRRPNILYVFSDQHRAQSLPGEPLNEAVAPTLDRFRRESLSMDACISNYPLCVPHRAMLISGLYPTQSRIVHNQQTLEPGVPGLGDTFRKAGYRTGYIGKWHLYAGENQFVPPGPYRFGFDHWQAWANTNKHYDGITFHPKTGERETVPGYQPTRMTDQALEFLNGQKGATEPWLLVLSWNPPHPPYDPPAKERDLYDAAALKFRPNVRLPTPADRTVQPWPALASFDTLHAAEQGYYGAITAIDREFARLLKALEDNQQAANTIVIYTSDHGEMMGSHGHMAKQMPHEESCRVPFFIRIPDSRTAVSGRRCPALFSSIDLYPTLCGLARIPVPGHCAGRDYSAFLRQGGAPPSSANGVPFHEPDMVFLMNEQGPGRSQEINTPTYRGVRTRTHTYAVQLDGRWCLYDNVADPYQMKNLIRDPAQRQLLERFDAALIAWSKSTGDAFPYGEVLSRYSVYPGA